ncbi:MAG: tRNA-guanine transglycosylase [Anaerolineaceae bacterium]|nr:tRNA-guanine transglycosylase [Anaerolineaceae bacterium]
MPSFTVEYNSKGRLGQFSFENGITNISTPFMFPVASTVTGTTANGGGIWKYILQAYPDTDTDVNQALMRRGMPILSQALQFLDYGVSKNKVNLWRQQSIRKMYNEAHRMDYKAPIFLDSGGFKLMWREGLNLDEYGINLSPSKEAHSILCLQHDLGANIIASLDYPIPPNLAPSEAKQRMKRSRRNAITVARYLRDGEFSSWRPFLYMPVHGLSPEAISAYVKNLFNSVYTYGLGNDPIGIAVGSLVPLRFSRTNLYRIITIVDAAVKAIPAKYRDRIPVHVFGVTGILIPFLAYCGVDTYDSSTYVKEAINLRYMHPDTRVGHAVLEMTEDDFICDCDVCRNIKLLELQEALAAEGTGKPLVQSGHYKSKYYADIALHNLEQDFKILRETRHAIKQNYMAEFILQVAERFPRMRYALDGLCDTNKDLRLKASKRIQPVIKTKKITKSIVFQTLSHTPDDFNIAHMNGHINRSYPRILLLLPCSSDKPYSDSRTHKYVEKHIHDYIPGMRDKIHKVSLSGLYGPVPEEYETCKPVLDYNYRLIPKNEAQIELVTTRLVEYLEIHGAKYLHCVAYATSKAYRLVFEKTAEQYPSLTLLPTAPKSKRLTEFFRTKNIQELVNMISDMLD